MLCEGELQALASNAANRWRGSRRGAISMASKRRSNSACSGCAISQACAASMMRCLLARRHRIGGLIEAGAGLDLDEDEQIALARHEVDLAIGRAKALWPGCDSPWPSDRRRRGSPRRGRFGTPRRAPGEASFGSLRLAAWRRQSSPSSLRTSFLGELERAGIDCAARPARQFDRMRHRILDAVALQR